MGIEILRAHVDLDISLEKVDPPAFREFVGLRPTPEPLEAMGLGGDTKC